MRVKPFFQKNFLRAHLGRRALLGWFCLVPVTVGANNVLLAKPRLGNTVVIAFSATTRQHGWHAHPDGVIATKVAVRNCRALDAIAVCNATNGYLALVWGEDGSYAWGASVDLPDEAYENAVRNFRKLHPSSVIEGEKVVSSDGFVFPVR